MNSEDNFKKSLQDMLGSREFSFDEENWDKARQMIDASRKRRRAVPFFLAASLLLISLLTGIYFLSGPAATPTAVAAAPQPKTSATPTLSVMASSSKVESSASGTAIQPGTSSQAATPEHSGPAKAAHPSRAIPATTKEVPTSSAAASEKTPTLAQHATSQTTHSPAITKQPPSFTTAPAAVPSAPSAVGSSTEPDSRGNTVAKAETGTSKNEGKEPLRDDTKKEEEEPAQTSAEQFAADLSSDTGAQTMQPAIVTATTAAATLPEKEPVLNRYDSLVTIVNPAPAKTDTLLPADNDQGHLGKPRSFLVLASAEAGTNYLFGWKNPGTRDAKGFSPFFGVNCFFNQLAPKMSLSIGLHYFEVRNLSYSTYTSKVIRLSFGEQTNVSVFTPVKVYYLMAPLRFNYHISPMNTIGIGCNVSYLINVKSEIETYTEKLNARYNEEHRQSFGYTEGFKKYDAQLSLFYNRKLCPNLGVNLEVFYGLTDVKDNTLFHSSVVERNSGLKLSLVYNFLKR